MTSGGVLDQRRFVDRALAHFASVIGTGVEASKGELDVGELRLHRRQDASTFLVGHGSTLTADERAPDGSSSRTGRPDRS